MTEVVHQPDAVFLELAKDIASELNIDQVVPKIISRVQKLLDVDRCTLFLVDQDSQELIVMKQSSTGSGASLPFQSGSNEFRMPLKGIAGDCAKTGKPSILTDVYKDPRWSDRMDKATKYKTNNMLVCPLKGSDGKVTGVLQAINKNSAKGPVNQQDLELLSAFSTHAAVAVNNSRLYSQTQKALDESTAMVEISRALSSKLAMPELVQIIVKTLHELMDVDRCTLFLVDGGFLTTSSKMSVGRGQALPIMEKREDIIRMPKTKGLIGAVVKSKEFLHVPDAYKDERFNKEMDKRTGYHTRNMLIMPSIDDKGSVIAVVQLMNKMGEKPFTPDDIRKVKSFSHQITAAISNSMMFGETEKALNHTALELRNLKLLLAVARSSHSKDTAAKMMQEMVPLLRDLMSSDDCYMFLVYNDRKGTKFCNVKNPQKKYEAQRGFVGHVIKTKEELAINGKAYADAKYDREIDGALPQAVNTENVLTVPVLVDKFVDSDDEEEEPSKKNEKDCVGVVQVHFRAGKPKFKHENTAHVLQFVAQMSISINVLIRNERVLKSDGIREADTQATENLVEKYGMKLVSDSVASWSVDYSDLQLSSEIGSGSYGKVYKGYLMGEKIAIKRLHSSTLKKEHVEAFCAEAALMVQFKHDNIVQFKGAVADMNNFCILTEYCRRGGLTDILLDMTTKLDDKLKVSMLHDAARGMRYLHHECNPCVLHRDLKSDNLLVTSNWTTKVGDFGLTRFRDERKNMTQVGTPMWMAPEVILGDKYTEKADVYSFGIIMWEVLTRAEPYEDKEMMQIVVEVVNENLRPKLPSSHKNNPMVPLMKECWSARPDDRPNFLKICERFETIKVEVAKNAEALMLNN